MNTGELSLDEVSDSRMRVIAMKIDVAVGKKYCVEGKKV
jgi:hypothetical protein